MEEFESWPGLLVLHVDPERGRATVLVGAGRGDDLTAALERSLSAGSRPW